ncbi:MAG: hypothetical protein J6R52_04440 [Alphaproteobacteria bacterium]|nr:hypothetical protein [Alphaproteobacteria bacterium]
MAEKLLENELRDVINALQQATDANRSVVIDTANDIMANFVNGNLELDDNALTAFADFLMTFGVTQGADGKTTFNSKIAEQAAAKFEGIIATKEAQERGRATTNRIYSLNSDANQMKFDVITLGVYQAMGLVGANLDVNNMTPSQVATEIDRVKLTNEQKTEYAARFVDATLSDMSLFESVPPSVLADAYAATRTAIAGATDEQTKATLNQRFATLATRIDFLIENFSSQMNYWYVNPSNLMDVHDGYVKMFDVRQPDLAVSPNQNQATQEYNKRINDKITDSREKLSAAIKEYDELYHLTQLNPDNAEELKQRWIDLKTRLAGLEVTPETLAVAAKYHFKDENGNPIPQFLDENNQPSLEYRDGCKLDPNGRLAQVLNLSRNDVVMENVADLGKKVEDMNLSDMLNEEVPWTFSEISIPDEVAQGIAQAPNRMQDEAYVQQLWDDIKTNGGSISDKGYQAALDAHVNNAAGFATRLGQKVGTDKDVVYMPFEAVQDIDKLASTRTEKEGAEGRKKKVGFFKRMAKNFGMAAAVSAGLTFIGKATGIAWAGAAVGTTIGVGNMIYQGFKWRKEQKKAGKPHGLKDFLKDKRNWGPAVATGLGVAATISLATGNPELAMGFGLGAVAAGTGSSAAMVYKDAINAGYTRGQALAGAIGVGASGILGAWAGNAAMNGLVNYVNNNTDSTLFKHGETVQTSHEETRTTQHTEYETSTVRQYADGVIDSNERLMLEHNWETQASYDARIDGLMDAGLSHDDAVRYLLAFHDATDHNLGPGYFDSIGMSPENLSALRNSINGTEINLTPESLAAFEHFNPHISAINQVGYVPGAPVDFQLPSNAMYDANGVLVQGNELYTTYAEHSTPIYNDVTITTPVTVYGTETVLVPGTETIFTPNELAFPAGIGTFGIYEPRVVPDNYVTRLRERAGALADRIEEKPRREFRHLPQIDPYQEDEPTPGPIDPIDPVDPVDPDDDDKKKKRKKTRIPDYDLELDAKLNMDKNDPDKHKVVNVKVDGQMKNVQVVSDVNEDSMHIKMTVPYNINQGKGYYKVVYKTFSGEIKEAQVSSRATDNGIHIDIMMDGVSIKDKGRYKLYFQYVQDENKTEHTETITKKTRFKRTPVAPEQNNGGASNAPQDQGATPGTGSGTDAGTGDTPPASNAPQDQGATTGTDSGTDADTGDTAPASNAPQDQGAAPGTDSGTDSGTGDTPPQGDKKKKKKNKRTQFEAGTAQIQNLSQMIETVRQKEQRAKKQENKAAWHEALEQLMQLEQDAGLNAAEKQMFAQRIVDAASSTVGH